VPDINIDNLYT